MLKTKILKSASVEGVAVVLTKQWMPDVQESNCSYKITRSDKPKSSSVCYMHGEAEIYFNMAVEELTCK